MEQAFIAITAEDDRSSTRDTSGSTLQPAGGYAPNSR
jgi:hypothetical protein